MKTGKNFKIFGVRGSLIGDSIMALPILNWLEKQYPNSYKYWQVSRKCSQAAPLYFNHPLIDQIVISDGDEGFGPRDREIARQCDIVFNLMPQHPEGDSWPNRRTIFEETWVMAGLPLSEYHKMSSEDRRPKLSKWFKIDKQPPKTIAIWPCAGYGKENRRNPDQFWYNRLFVKLKEAGYRVLQFGHPNDFVVGTYIANDKTDLLNPPFVDNRHLSFFDQIKLSLGCDLVIGTDSGAGLVIGAYEHRQISLLTNHWPGHTDNLLAFATNNPNNHNFFASNSASNIDVDEVFNKIRELIK